MPTHITEDDFEKNFPASSDVLPTLVDKENYIDAVTLNALGDSILAVEDYLITYKTNIEGGGGGIQPAATVGAVNETPETAAGVAADMASMMKTISLPTITSP